MSPVVCGKQDVKLPTRVFCYNLRYDFYGETERIDHDTGVEF